MDQITRTFCYTHPSGEDIYLFRLRNVKGTEVTISNYGAIITSFKIKTAPGFVNDIVLGFDKIEDYQSPAYLQNYPWFGAAIGRYANRIKGAGFELDGKKILLTANLGTEQLHGGREGFDKKVWQLVSFGHYPRLFLEMKYKSPKGEEGYPANLETTIRFELGGENELSYTYSAICDEATPINLTHHSYFNLNNGEGPICDHEIKIPADEILGQDDHLVADGSLKKVEGTAHDLRDFYSIGEGLKKIEEYDQSFVTRDTASPETILVAEARSRKSGILLKVYSTEPVVHFYSGKWIPSIEGKNGNLYGPFSGLCLETHKHPNALNLPGFPDTILRSGQVYHHKTEYRIVQDWEK